MSSIFISGGSKGIGLAIAKRYHANGWQVGIAARGEAALAQAKADMPGIETFTCDMSKKEAVKSLAQEVQSRMGRLDVLVNNAGVFMQGNLHDEADEAFENMMALNLNSAYYLTKALLPDMIAQKQGAIVNVCSVASIKAYPGGGSYGVSKYALLGFSKNLREEMKPHNIRVISLMPGAVFTASWEGVDVEEDRLMPADDIASLVWTATDLSNRTVIEDIVVRPQLGDL
ncbi:MAG: SDR family oxidoreductase [Bacteroidia bacterium]